VHGFLLSMFFYFLQPNLIMLIFCICDGRMVKMYYLETDMSTYDGLWQLFVFYRHE